MGNKKSINVGLFIMWIVAVSGAMLMIMFPEVLSQTLSIFAWVMIGTIIIAAIIIHYVHNKKKKLIEEHYFEQALSRKRAKREKERIQQEKRFQKIQKIAANKEAAHEEKQNKIKADMVKQAKIVWEEREIKAQHQERTARKCIADTLNMGIRTVAGYIATEWNEASRVARWTAQQLVMFSRRPNVTMQARIEAQEAIMKAAEIRANGNSLTKKQGNYLKIKKQKARDEVKIEEARLKAIQDVIDNAEITWRGIEMRVNRRQEALNLLISQQKDTKS